MPLPAHLGMEIELCTNFDGMCGRLRSLDSDDRLFVRTEAEGIVLVSEKASGTLLKNGGILYNDVGEHIEYASPETEKPLDLVLGARAVQHTIFDVINTGRDPENAYQMNARSAARQDPSETAKRALSTFANHENYEIREAMAFPVETAQRLIAIHVASRTVFGGAGAVLTGKPMLSARVGYAFTGNHFLHGMDGIFGRKSDYYPRTHLETKKGSSRLEVRFAEDQPSDWAKFINVASTAMLMTAITENPADAKRLLEDIDLNIHILTTLNRDTNLKATIPNDRGQQVSLLDVQQTLYDFTSKRIKEQNLPDQYKLAMKEWGQALADLREGAVEPTDGRIDWLGRLAYWEQVRQEAYSREFDDTDICYTYDRFRQGKGFIYNGQNAVRLGADFETADYVATPPSRRAARRVDHAVNGKPFELWTP